MHVDGTVKVYGSPGLMVPGKDIVVPPGSGGSAGSNGVKVRRCRLALSNPSSQRLELNA